MRRILLSALLLCTMPAFGAPPSVIVHYIVDEPSADKVHDSILLPVEHALHDVPRVKRVRGSATHWRADLEIDFDSGATTADLANVTAIVDRVELPQSVKVRSRELLIGPPTPFVMYPPVQAAAESSASSSAARR